MYDSWNDLLLRRDVFSPSPGLALMSLCMLSKLPVLDHMIVTAEGILLLCG